MIILFESYMIDSSKKIPIIKEFIDKKTDLHAILVIDSLINENSCGGIRILEDLTLEEIKALAHAMTIKYCFLKENTGGAKAGIILPKNCTKEMKKEILESFGRNASYILKKKLYIPWTDINSNINDIYTVMNAAGCEFHEIPDSSYFTALSVASAVKASCEIKDIEISNTSVIIEGLGAVGINIASELTNWGVKIVGVSTIKGAIYDKSGINFNKILELQKLYKDDFINYCGIKPLKSKELLLEMKTDILIPCARTWSINSRNMRKIKSKLIVPGANVPFTNEAEEYLYKKGILCLPDFICNSGGVFGTKLFYYGNSKSKVYKFIINEFGLLVKELLLKSKIDNCSPIEIALKVAEKNCKENNTFNKYKSFLTIFKNFPILRGWIIIHNERKIINDNIKIIKLLS